MRPEVGLLLGKLDDSEYFALLGGGIPKRGWVHRQARIRRAVLEALVLLASFAMVVLVVWAMSIPMPR